MIKTPRNYLEREYTFNLCSPEMKPIKGETSFPFDRYGEIRDAIYSIYYDKQISSYNLTRFIEILCY